jgi:tetratricopeptide (TPR) repeat protein
MNRSPEAEAEYREALRILTRLVASCPTVPAYRRDLAITYMNLANRLKDPDQAETAYRKALAEQAKLAAEFAGTPDYRFGVAKVQMNLGHLLQQRHRTREAAAAHQEALTVLTQLVKDYPAVPGYSVELGGTCCNLGMVEKAAGTLQGAQRWYDKAIATLEAVRARDPRDATARRFLRNTHWGRADLYNRLGRFPEAVKDWERALALSPSAEQPTLRILRAVSLVRAGDRARATQAAEEWAVAKDVNAGPLYAAASIYALATAAQGPPEVAERYAVRAVELLRRAYDNGYKGKPGIKDDKNLDALRSRDDFRRLLAELNERTGGR